MSAPPPPGPAAPRIEPTEPATLPAGVMRVRDGVPLRTVSPTANGNVFADQNGVPP
ncbi:hypothetical protein GCM10018953_49530 [Streptosporangium nondiastaticum]